jgi:hypothetical protein
MKEHVRSTQGPSRGIEVRGEDFAIRRHKIRPTFADEMLRKEERRTLPG